MPGPESPAGPGPGGGPPPGLPPLPVRHGPGSRPVFLPGGSGPPAAPHPEVTLEAAIPFAGQANHWSAADQRRRMTLLDQCDLETVVQHTYTPGCMNRRNRYMVDRSSLLIAVYDGIPQGGTLNTLSYAMGKGVRTVILPVVSPAQ
ncbi:MAG: SLOG family protein [Evtepia gabavorous]